MGAYQVAQATVDCWLRRFIAGKIKPAQGGQNFAGWVKQSPEIYRARKSHASNKIREPVFNELKCLHARVQAIRCRAPYVRGHAVYVALTDP